MSTPIPAPNPPPARGRPLSWAKVAIGEGIIIILLLALVGVLVVTRPTTQGTTHTGNTPVAFGNTPTSAPGITPSAGVTETPTPETTPGTTPTTPPTTATPPSGLLCNVDIGSWTGGSADWKLLNGVLLNDGSAYVGDGGNGGPTIVAPCQLGNAADYAIETKIQVTSGDSCFGINTRGSSTSNGWQGYSAEVCGGGVSLHGSNTPNPQGAFSPGDSTHTYRVEVKGNTVKFIIDGAAVVTLTDNHYLTGVQVGLWDSNVQLQVTSFKVMTL